MSEILQSEESVKLYEYEPYKEDLEDYIAHHGVKDMHWGVRNGPPYPLSSKLSTGSRLKKGAKGVGGSYGGNSDKLKKKATKAAVKAAKANKKAAQAGNSLLHPFKSKRKDKLQAKAFKAQSKADKLNAKLDKEELKETTKKKIEERGRQNKIDKEVETARKTGMYDMEFLERNLDQDQKTGELLKGKALDDAYRKFLDERGFPGVPGRDSMKDTKYGGFREIRTSEKITDLDERKSKGGQIDISKRIKPQEGTSVKDAKDFWRQEFDRQSRENVDISKRIDPNSTYGGKDVSKKFENEYKEILKTAKTDEEKDKRIRELNEKYIAKANKKSFTEKLHDRKVQKQRAQSLEKARQTKAENTAKKKAEAEEKEKISKMREEAIKKNDIVTMYKNANHFSNEEIETALNRKGVIDRLASEVAKSNPNATASNTQSTSSESPKKEKYFKSMVKQKTTEGLKSAAESVVKGLSQEALKMTMEQLALTAAGVTTNDKWDDKQKLEKRRNAIVRLIKHDNV